MALMLDNYEGIILSLDSHKSVPAPFLTKTYQLVDDYNTDHIVSWGEDDTTFVVWRPPEFSRDLLPNYFKHNNFSSFVRQLNTYGFRKIVPDRWEFANEFFKRGEKHLLCEIHRRKTSQPQLSFNHHNQNAYHQQSSLGMNSTSFFPSPTLLSISPTNSDEQHNWSDSPPIEPPAVSVVGNNNLFHNSVTALSEDNQRLRRSNSMLISELAHMRKLYNDIIYFVQNHVKPVTPSDSYPSCLLPAVSNNMNNTWTEAESQNPMNQLIGYNNYSSTANNTKQNVETHGSLNSPSTTSKSSVTIVEGIGRPSNINNNGCKIKLFGVSLLSKKRLHPENGINKISSETNKARLVLDNDELGLNLMPPSTY